MFIIRDCWCSMLYCTTSFRLCLTGQLLLATDDVKFCKIVIVEAGFVHVACSSNQQPKNIVWHKVIIIILLLFYFFVPSFVQKPIKNFGEKGAWGYPGTAQSFWVPPIISGTGKATKFKFGKLFFCYFFIIIITDTSDDYIVHYQSAWWSVCMNYYQLLFVIFPLFTSLCVLLVCSLRYK